MLADFGAGAENGIAGPMAIGRHFAGFGYRRVGGCANLRSVVSPIAYRPRGRAFPR
ncbi:hypothetical protein [Microbulbifer halophilus]|uniref:hypothetical protein n=1 Tax=Microbulbifer halophilus TaxID=453963 RepID=UPI003606C0B7